MCAMLRNRWFTHPLMAGDLHTSISGFKHFDSFDTIVKALRYLGAIDQDLDELLERAERMGPGSCTFTLLPGRKNLLGIKPEWLRKIEVPF